MPRDTSDDTMDDDVRDEIEALVERFVDDLERLHLKAAKAAVDEALRDAATTSGPARSRATKPRAKKKTTKKARGRKRSTTSRAAALPPPSKGRPAPRSKEAQRKMAAAIRRHLTRNSGAKMTELREVAGYESRFVRPVVDTLLRHGELRKEGSGPGVRYFLAGDADG